MSATAATATAKPELPGLANPQPAVPQTSAAPSRPTCPNRRDTLRRHLAEGEPLKAALIGRLAADARLVPDPDDGGRLLIEVLLHQHVGHHPRVWPVVAVYDPAPDTTPAHHHALVTRLAASLLAGVDVVLLGRGLEAAEHQGAPCLRLLHAIALRPEAQVREDLAAPPEPDLFNPAAEAPAC
jgi:hypothetical protein